MNRAEIRRRSGAVQVFHESLWFDSLRITVTVAGTEPLDAVAARFDELVRTHAFEARFIRYPGEEGLLSPLDVMRRIQAAQHVPAKVAGVTITVPPQGTVVISDNPALVALIGDPPPADGSLVERHPLIQFDQNEASFRVDQVERPLFTVQLHFSVRQEDRRPVEGESYRYASPSGVIEIAEHKASVGNREFFLTEHRSESEDGETGTD